LLSWIATAIATLVSRDRRQHHDIATTDSRTQNHASASAKPSFIAAAAASATMSAATTATATATAAAASSFD